MPAGTHYDSLPFYAERNDEQGMYQFGVVIDNAKITLIAIKTGTVDELVERARVKAEQEAQSQSQPTPPPTSAE
jgi:hypothetical protein